jgi:hypothetical protein
LVRQGERAAETSAVLLNRCCDRTLPQIDECFAHKSLHRGLGCHAVALRITEKNGKDRVERIMTGIYQL